MPRRAHSLQKLLDQVNAAHPQRIKISDGWIGDAAHAARKSDHNPNYQDVVQAQDITHDPDHGFDSWAFAERLRQNRDPRIKYVISNGRIFSSTTEPWTWRPYTGSNKHAHHVHVSVVDDPALYDDKRAWALGGPQVTPRPPQASPVSAAARDRMAQLIMNWEAVRDAAGHVRVHQPGDGSYEVAGINSGSHPAEAARIRVMVETGKHAEAERAIRDFVLAYTSPAAGLTTDAGVEFFLRDTMFNRGPEGAARVLQRAVDVPDDGEVGPLTRSAMARLGPEQLIGQLREAREEYEWEVIGRREQYVRGLTNRWNNAQREALKFHREQPPAPGREIAAGGAVVVPPVVAAATTGDIGTTIAVLVISASVAAIIWKIWPRRRVT